MSDIIPPELTQKEQIRYSRHLLLPEVGVEGQLKLRSSRVLVVGAGGLGSPVLLYLTGAGVGTIGIVDFDDVDLTNLQRQVLFEESAVGSKKSTCAAQRLIAINSDISLRTFDEKLTAENALRIFSDFDVIVDGTDNFPTRYLVNDACRLLNKPNVYGSIYRFEGQVSVFCFKDGPCYRCLFPDPPPPEAVPNCAAGGVLGVLAGVVGSLQCTEALKIILGCGAVLSGRLLLYDALTMSFSELSINRRPDCPRCGDKPTITTLLAQQSSCNATNEIEARELRALLNDVSDICILDVRTIEERNVSYLPHSIHIPLPDLDRRMNELDREVPVIVYCRSGTRSHKAQQLLQQSGFRRVTNLSGGIAAWQREVDPAMPVA